MPRKLSPILSDDESVRFNQLRKVLKTEQAGFWRFADALSEIRQKRLFRENFETFEAFLEGECGFTRQRAQQLIDASRFRREQRLLAEAGEPATVPATERQARALMTEAQAPETTPADLPPPKQAPEPKSTTSTVVDDSTSQQNKNRSSAPEPDAKIVPVNDDNNGVDRMGYPLPKGITEGFNGWHRMQRVVDYLRNIRHEIDESRKANPTYAHLSNSWVADLDKVIFELKQSMPYAVCPYCQGRNIEQCGNCHHTGFVSQWFWDRAALPELKQLREIQIKKLVA